MILQEYQAVCKRNIALICVISLQISSITTYEKVWIPDTNYNNPNNWDGQEIPCAKDRVVFPRNKNLSIFVKNTVFAREMILPLNGELILEPTSEIGIGIQSGQKCEGRDAHFIATEEHHWYDPSNWQIKDPWGNLASATAGGSIVNPVPLAQRVPCALDDVVFPVNSTFKVILEGLGKAKLRSISINGQKLSTTNLTKFLSSSTGSHQFNVESTGIEVEGLECADFAEINGCTCSNEEPRRLTHICEHTIDHCPPLHCTDPIHPAASCCPICGSILKVAAKSYINFWLFRQHVGTYFVRERFRSVSGYMFKTRDGQIQIILTHSEPHGSEELAEKIVEDLSESYYKLIYGVTAVSLETSQNWFSGPAAITGNTHSGMSSGGVAALIIGLLAVTIMGVLFYSQRHRLIPLAFSFGRFENEEDQFEREGALEMAVEMTQTIDTGIPPTSSVVRSVEAQADSTIKGFDNPFYDPKCEDVMGFGSATASKKVTDPGENPCYLAFERVEDIPAIVDISAWPSSPATVAPDNVSEK